MSYRTEGGIATYEGDFKDGLKWGKGTMVSSDGQYNGEWGLDDKNGRGTMKYSNGDRYEGTWKNGVRSGEGTYFYYNGDRYVGRWVDDRK